MQCCMGCLPICASTTYLGISGWQPLQNPFFGSEVMSSWKDLLQGDQPYDFSDATESMPPYAQLGSEVILLVVLISGTNSRKARDPEPMLHFLESWERLLPPIVLHSILEHVKMPKLIAAVESWTRGAKICQSMHGYTHGSNSRAKDREIVPLYPVQAE